MTPDECFSQMALVLNMPEDSGYEGILENLKFLKEERVDAEARFELVEEAHLKLVEEKKKLKKENMKLMEQNTKLAQDYVSISRPRRESPPRNIDGDVVLRLKKQIDELKEQIDELKKDMESAGMAEEAMRFMGWDWNGKEWVEEKDW